MRTPRPRLQLLLVTVLSVGSFVALVLTRPELGRETWSRGTDLALGAAWIVAVATSAWLLLATGSCALALAFDRPAVARRIAPALPGSIRKVVEIAIAGSCIAFPALPALPAHAAGPPPLAAVVVADQPVVRAPEVPAPVTTPPVANSGTVVVGAGDNLWVIARTALARTSAASPTERDVARYWLAVIAANRTTLRSGNPSLIFPGEIVTLPPVGMVS